jgi:hypothetical protein
MKYGGKEITDIPLWELGAILNRMNIALDQRERASQHVKFNADREVNGKKVHKMEFPPINQEFLKIKNEIELEIKRKQSNV